MSHTYSCLYTHVVFSTKDRRKLITPALKPGLLAYMGGIVRELGGKAVTIGGTADHVHVLLRLPPTLCPADCLRLVKTNSSRWARQQKRVPFAWQTGYAAFSVSASSLGRVSAYVRDQQQHHRKFSFQDELLALLKKHGVEYDERYLWD